MTKHKAGETKAERQVRRIVERSEKEMKAQHIDERKYMKELGEGFRRIT
jgi:hypothetical protein